MKIYGLKFFLAGLLFSFYASAQEKEETRLRLWYDQPARPFTGVNNKTKDEEWVRALPVGNGFLGAMVFGDVNRDLLQLNEKTLWSGSPDDNDNPAAAASLGKIRQLIFEGKYKEARQLTETQQVCKGVGSGRGNGAGVPYGSYQTLGDLTLDFEKNTEYTGYTRELDLEKGVITIAYSQGGVQYKREIFVSYPDRALVVRLSADKKGMLSFKAFLNRPERFTTVANGSTLTMSGVLENGKGGEGMRYAARLKASSRGGKVLPAGQHLIIEKADEVVLVLTAATDYKAEYPVFKWGDPLVMSLQQLNAATSVSYSTLLKRHLADYSRLFGKVKLRLSDKNTEEVPTDRRLTNPDDLHLQELYFQYGRYLLISSSRAGSMPANLQGIWSDKIQAPWNCDYHTNINLQMNYWPAGVTNLEECFGPMSALIESLVKPGSKTAAVQYNARGWCAQPITNVWGYTSPGEGTSWGLYVAGGGWLCRHLWDHYLFTRDEQYLKRVYPVMLEAARFYLDWLVRDPVTGKLVSGPSTSPENSFIAPDGSVTSICMGPAHDQQIIQELFENVISASAVLKEDQALLSEIAKALPQLAPTRIGDDGRIMEWTEAFKETEVTHRHVSHLYFLYPGTQVDPVRTPELAQAARKSLDVRTDIGTGWSLAWKVNFWARLRDGERAYQLLKNLLHPTVNASLNMSDGGGTYPNLFCAHPPFQIDGNLGGTAGIAEMLLQSHQEILDLLPALPSAWKNGEAEGLVGRGAFLTDMQWKSGLLTKAVITSLAGGRCVIRTGIPVSVQNVSAETVQEGASFLTSFTTEKGKKYTLIAKE